MNKFIIALCLVGIASSGSVAFGQTARAVRVDTLRAAPSPVTANALTPLTR